METDEAKMSNRALKREKRRLKKAQKLEEEEVEKEEIKEETVDAESGEESEVAQNKPPKQFEKSWQESYVVEITRLPGKMEDIEIEDLVAPFKPDACLFFECDEETKSREARVTFTSKAVALRCTTKLHKSRVNSMLKLARKPNSPGIQIHARITNLDLSKDGPDRTEAKKSRIIVRNLRFNINDSKLRNVFGEYGTVTDVSIPKNDKGKKLGFAFVQFVSRWEANKAIRGFKTHNKIQGRPVAVDLALPKDQYLAEKLAKDEQKSLDEDSGDESEGAESEPEDEEMSVDEADTDNEVESSDSESEASDGGDSDLEDVSLEKQSKKVTENGDLEEKSSRDDVHEGKTVFIKGLPTTAEHKWLRQTLSQFGDIAYLNLLTDPETKECKGSAFAKFRKKESADEILECKLFYGASELLIAKAEKKQKVVNQGKKFGADSSYDVHEGRTLFVRNVPYDGDNESMAEVFEVYGKLKYAICMMNHDTQTCKGTGFVQFQAKADTEKVLALETPIQMNGRELAVSVALDRKSAKEKTEISSKTEGKDSRKIYLSKEGVIRPDTAAAEGVSEHDMQLREKLLETLKKKLKNDNMFMSEQRLVIHNIPKAYSDMKMKDVVYETVRQAKSTTTNVKSARLGKIKVTVMRNREGNNKSLGFGFVQTDSHDAALLILRALNNNPECFTNEKRPVVEFCCENRKAIEVQQRRRQRAFEKRAPEQTNNNAEKSKQLAKKARVTQNAASKVDIEQGKLFKFQGMPAQRRKKGEKLTVPRLKKKARHNESSKRAENTPTAEDQSNGGEGTEVKKKAKKSRKRKNSASEDQPGNRKGGLKRKEAKEEQNLTNLIQKYSAKLKS